MKIEQKRTLAAIAAASLLWMSVDGVYAANTPSVPLFGKYETNFHIKDVTGNPFDPTVNDVDAKISGSNGLAVTVPAFYDGDGVWKVRYAPTRIGKYTVKILRNGIEEHPSDLSASSFQCIGSIRPGFVRIDKTHRQRFVFDNGLTYYPIGCDQAWGNDKPGDYSDALAKMKDAGMNWARIWMNHWDNKNLEWTNPTSNSPRLGEYSLHAARRWDSILENAETNGVYVQLTLQHHGQWTRRVDPNWSDNPYNAAMPGGFLKNPEDFFTDPRAIALTKAKYRYIVARWGYSDHIMGWELFNEIQNNPEVQAHFDKVIAWHQMMADYIRSIDPNHHLITSSYTDPGNDLERGVTFDFDQKHAYVTDIVGLFASIAPAKNDRPWFYGEWGHAGGNWGNDAQSAAFLHDGIWSGMMAPIAGSQQFWYWDEIDRKNWWPEYKTATDYIKASQIAQQKDISKVVAIIACDTLGNLSLAPSMGWGDAKSYEATVLADGTIAGIDGMPSFIQGPNHREMMKQPLTFKVNMHQPSQFTLRIATVSAGGAHPQLLLDGRPVADKNLAGTGQDRQNTGETLTIDVPAGPHTVGVFNTENDWFTVQNFTLTHAVPELGAIAKGNADHVYFWAYSRSRPYDAPSKGGSVSGSLTFDGLKSGRYKLFVWTMDPGVPAKPPIIVEARSGKLTVPVSITHFDSAGWIEPAR